MPADEQKNDNEVCILETFLVLPFSLWQKYNFEIYEKCVFQMLLKN